MTQTTDVTYTGTEDPFVDRIYHSGLTFTPGQTRPVPLAIAQRLLRHADVFQESAAVAEKPKAAKPAKPSQEPPVDDTAQQLTQADADAQKRLEAENHRFDLLQQVERMDKTALRDFAKVNYRQDIHPNTGLEKARDMVRGFIDQFGAL